MDIERINRDRERFEGPIFAFRDAAFDTFPDEPERRESILKALSDSEQVDTILAKTDSLMHSPPEMKFELSMHLYYIFGLRDVLYNANLDKEERSRFVNNLAGESVITGIKKQKRQS